jgi:cyclase
MGKVPEPFVEEVADGVFAYVQPDGSWFLNNTGIVVGPDTVVMVDQTSTADRGRALLETVDRVGGGKPVQALVNTHHHGDHTFGNYLVPAGTSIIGHHRCRLETKLTGTAITALFQGPEWGDIEVRPAMITFDDRLCLWSGERRIDLIHFGTPAHTTNDVVAWFPDEEIAFTGDLLFHRGTPFALQGSVTGWLEALDHLEALGAQRLVPGHGPLADPPVIDDVRRYLRFVLGAAEDGRASGLTPLEAAMDTDLGEFADLSDTERLVGNLHRAYHDLAHPELRGAPLDLGPIAADMMSYHGGPIVSHA